MAAFRLRTLRSILVLPAVLAGCSDSSGPSAGASARVSEVAAGFLGSCALTDDHRVWCWGMNPGTFVTDSAPKEVVTPEPLVSLRASWWQYCGQAASSAVYCWGTLIETDVGFQIGDGTTPMKLDEGVLAGGFAAGSGHACALGADSLAVCWGSYVSGKRGIAGPYPVNTTGLASFTDLTVKPVSGGNHFIALSAGTESSCGIRVDRTVACWGDSVGIGAPLHTYQHDQDTCWLVSACSSTPVLVPGLSGAFALVSGPRHTCALASGGLSCWGYNGFHELGSPDVNAGASPVTVSLPESPVAVTAGGVHTCALTGTGAAYCWGDNGDGQVGIGSTGGPVAPSRVQFDGRFTQLSAGSMHTCGVTTDGRLYCWGSTTGNRAEWSSPLPVRVLIPE